ncbi:hypothetical protein K443DRAFT_129793 [Laccaria amethystina LaAM-08-1]|uniref:RlpA-like protein double-psi beta-barrel domain-containing protein n=1 Tax=Laccaria amethystina LaAM-08-1 TaxID=1095629 RepID=A0A0C9Y8K9_9AGAR|nr:hypothetical protein K443DRAFT_129793 [Laccaria amethystina LaAM-08-1]
MKSLGLSTILALSLPFAALAGHINQHFNRHQEVARRAPAEVQLQKRFDSARWSYYETQTGNAGACGQFLSDSDFIVALNTPQYGSGSPGPQCFKTITMSYGGKSTTARIMDQCPGCPYGGLDLSPGLFAFFAPLGTGIIYGTWNFGDSAPAPAPTTTYKAPAPTTTWKPSPTSTWSPPPTTSTTKTSSSSSSSSSSLSSSPAAASSPSAKHSGTSSSAPAASVAAGQGPNALDNLNQVFIRIGGIIVVGASAN